VEDGAEPPPPYGFEQNRRSLALAFEYSAQQKITPRVYTAEELYHPI